MNNLQAFKNSGKALDTHKLGFSLLEIVAVLLILGVVAAFAARPVAQTMGVWLETMRGETDRSELNYVLEKMAREVRQGNTEGLCSENEITVDLGTFNVVCNEDNPSYYTLRLENQDIEVETHVFCRGCD